MSELTYTSPLIGIATSVFDVIWTNGRGFLGRLKVAYRKLLARHQINTALLKYENRFRARYGQVKPIDRNETFDIDLVFTDIECIDNAAIFQGADCLQSLELNNFNSQSSEIDNPELQDLEAQFHDERRLNRNQNSERKSIFEIAKTTPQLMLRGGPGAGKTTFLKKVGMEVLKPSNESKYGHNCIPVFIELKRLTAPKTDIEKLIREKFKTCGMPDAFKFTRGALQMGKLLILLDGMDEIPYENLQDALLKIKFLAKKYPQNRYIATCREGANYYSLLDTFKDIYIADFSDRQINTFVDFWFQRESFIENDPYESEQNLARQKSFLWMLETAKNPAIKELARNPLLLTLLCLFYQECNSLPNNRVNLFDQALDLFINKWFATKKVQPNYILGKELNPMLEKAMLSEVAYKGLISNRFFFSDKEIIKYIKVYMESNLNAPDLDGNDVLSAIKIFQGILVSPAPKYCSFSHVTFQEYLAAQYVHNRNTVSQLVDEHIADPQWKEVFSMISGLSTFGSDRLLQEMEEKGRLFLRNKKVNALVDWSKSVVSARVQFLADKNSRTSSNDEDTNPKHLEPDAWELILKHAATYYILGTLLNSYARALDDYREGRKAFSNNKIELSNMLIRYSSLIISDVYEYLSSGSISKRQSDHLMDLIGSIRRIGVISKSIINAEGCNRGALSLAQLQRELLNVDVFHGKARARVRENIALLKRHGYLDSKASATDKRKLVTKMWKNWLVGLGLVPFDIMDMTTHDMACLEKYLYTNSLIINCRIRAVNISHQAWNNTLLCMMRRTS
ncbi:MAG: NACHT domain-containing protein [Leptolyngbya sp. SIO3F4]|nr:NACHT domain-containing protein [Leptolyngbya sp. SIO3F4]